MLGVNIGVPVPREPFSFGGIHKSKFGDFDITGDGGVEFFTERRKITTKVCMFDIVGTPKRTELVKLIYGSSAIKKRSIFKFLASPCVSVVLL
jgi:hypothetical protein